VAVEPSKAIAHTLKLLRSQSLGHKHASTLLVRTGQQRTTSTASTRYDHRWDPNNDVLLEPPAHLRPPRQLPCLPTRLLAPNLTNDHPQRPLALLAPRSAPLPARNDGAAPPSREAIRRPTSPQRGRLLPRPRPPARPVLFQPSASFASQRRAASAVPHRVSQNWTDERSGCDGRGGQLDAQGSHGGSDEGQ
jgi:hypothetical protein